MSSPDEHDRLDAVLERLPKSIEPARDLWAGIEAQLEDVRPAAPFINRSSAWMQLAAAVLLVVATATTTYLLTRTAPTQAPSLVDALPAPALTTMPASFGGERLGAGYFEARAALDREFQARVAALPPAARDRVLADLAELRRAANDIAATLAEHPTDPLLQDLLLSTYQRELELFANVNDVARSATRTEL